MASSSSATSPATTPAIRAMPSPPDSGVKLGMVELGVVELGVVVLSAVAKNPNKIPIL